LKTPAIIQTDKAVGVCMLHAPWPIAISLAILWMGIPQ